MNHLKSVKIITLAAVLIHLTGAGVRSAASPRPPEEEFRELSGAKNDFALDLFSEVASEDENHFLSPYSIHTALLLAYTGSGGQTKEEIKEILALSGIEKEQLKEKARELKNHLENICGQTEVSIANALFLREDIPFLSSYKNDGKKYFQAEISSLPPKGETVNRWVRKKTRDKIEEIIDPGPIPGSVIAYLVNAIYFKGIWEKEFDEEKTAKRTFYGIDEKEIDMMEIKAEYRHRASEKMQSVTIEYKDGNYLFHAFMPTRGSLSDFYQTLDREVLEKAKPAKRGEIILRLPKFTLEDDLSLSEVLRAMGMEEAFDRDRANFSRMVDLEEISPLNVFVSEVYHSSFIELDEKGTEAAAATAVEMRLTSVPAEPVIIEFNRPFFFMIEEASTETILFMGQLVN